MQRLTSDIRSRKCIPCEGGVRPLKPDEFSAFLIRELKNWKVADSKILYRDFEFKNFKDALRFVNKVGVLAEEQGHHPDIYLHDWKMVKIELTTHAIGGLSENDFIMAVKIDDFYTEKF